jgi:hypothetical protein
MFLSNMSVKERIEGLCTEDVIDVLGKEPVKAVFLKRLSPEERLKGLGLEEIRKIRELLDKTS